MVSEWLRYYHRSFESTEAKNAQVTTTFRIETVSELLARDDTLQRLSLSVELHFAKLELLTRSVPRLTDTPFKLPGLHLLMAKIRYDEFCLCAKNVIGLRAEV